MNPFSILNFPGSAQAVRPEVETPKLLTDEAFRFVVSVSLLSAIAAVMAVASAVFGLAACLHGSFLLGSGLYFSVPVGYLAYNLSRFLRNLADMSETSERRALRSASVDSMRTYLGKNTFFFESFVAFAVDLVRKEVRPPTL